MRYCHQLQHGGALEILEAKEDGHKRPHIVGPHLNARSWIGISREAESRSVLARGGVGEMGSDG